MTFTSYAAANDSVNEYAPAFTAARTAVGVQVISGGGLDGITATALKFQFSKTGSPTGNVYARIYTPPVGAGLGTLRATSAGVDITTIGSGTTYDFPLLVNYTLQTDDMVCIEYAYTSGSFAIGRDTDETQPSDFDNSQMPGTWEVSGDYYSTYLIVTTGSPPVVSGGTRLPPPPIVLGGL